MRNATLVVVAVLLLAGCGGKKGANVSTQPVDTAVPGTTTNGESRAIQLYLLDPSDGKLVTAQTEIAPTKAVGAAALRALAEDPDSEVPPNLSLAIACGNAKVTGSELSPAALAQVVYTLTQFATVQSVNGLTRKDQDVEDFAPPILVEHPIPEATVASPLRVTGTANTFEATLDYELVSDGGKVLAHGFGTATSGSGERGTFDFAVDFQVAAKTDGALVVYESSAENGKRIHERRIPLTLRP